MPELAQHRRSGRVAAFGRHAADAGGAEQEGPASSVASILTQGTCRQQPPFLCFPPNSPAGASKALAGPWDANLAG